MPKAKSNPPALPTPRASALLRWYDQHGRDLPWRVKGGERPDPYRVWLSEVMLQQTTVVTVAPYYAKFLRRWPTVRKLAAADLHDVLEAWAGLGYYRRAHNLHRCAQVVVAEHGGKFPADLATLKTLPGIGTYTSAAIASIAFDQKANVVDGNVERVMARLYEVALPLPQAKATLTDYAAALLPSQRFGDYAQALMDLGATICTPKQPKCPSCPWQKSCKAYHAGTTAQFPVAAKKATKPIRYAVAFWLENAAGEVWLRRRPTEGLLGGMIEVPSTSWQDQPPTAAEIAQAAPHKADWQQHPATVRHSFTHFDLYITVLEARGVAKNATGFWAAPNALKKLALPSVMRKIAALVAQRR